MLFDHNSCYQALVRDRRFDGVVFVGVTTTGIYCRPVCPARTPRRERCRFFSNAASAENAGFRPCLRCRPGLAPGNAIVDAASRTAVSAAARIEAGALNEASVDDLAAEFGLSSRQLRRVVKSELGVTPIELAQTQRLLLAKQLLTDSSLPAIEVAFASGFSSVRQFNSLFRERYGLSPTDLRRSQTPQSSNESLSLELGYRPPFDWPSLLTFLRGRAIPGVEFIGENRYLRTAAIDETRGWFLVEPGARNHSLRIEISLSLARVLPTLLARIRNLFDLNAQPRQIEAHLCNDERLRPIVTRQSGLRLPGAFDVFEMAVRAILGQQVSVRAATTLAGRVANIFGDPIETPHAALTRTTMTADRLTSATTTDLTSLGLTRSRAACLLALAQAVAGGELNLQPGVEIERTIERLKQLPGIGDWTAHYIAMRALRWPDAFPHADLGLRKAMGETSSKKMLELAERWRPWRAYAVMHLWNSLGGTDR